MIEYLAHLKFIWNFLKPAMSDSIKERIKPKGSAEIAKKRTLRLYNSLGSVDQSIDAFIGPFEAYLELKEQFRLKIQDGEDIEEYFLKRGEMWEVVEDRVADIVKALIELTDSLEAINPQLEIHKPELVRMLEHVGIKESRGIERMAAAEVQVIPWRASNSQLFAILEDAKANRKMLHSTIKDYREFIIKEFPFKESF